MADIVLSTLNAKYIHCAFGLRYLQANLGALKNRSTLMEFTIDDHAADVVERILAHNPRIVGFGVYIWNIDAITRVVGTLKKVAPDITIVLGGPEVSHELESQTVCAIADYVIRGEGDVSFRLLCEQIVKGLSPVEKIIQGIAPDLDSIQLPYEHYTDEDISHRVIYVEASRGCPFSCQFCLSSLDKGVRNVSTSRFLQAMQTLYDRGLQHFKFVDRTFNLRLDVSSAILEFFLERYRPGLFIHFEMVPDRLPEPLRDLIRKFPPGSLQFEVGIQSFDPEVGARIQRRQNFEKLADNFRFLREHTGVHLHADLIAGLPGETLASFAAGFNRLVDLGPQEIQVGILKRLRGTPIALHSKEFDMRYSNEAPYEILSNSHLSFSTLQEIKRFARCWDRLANSGNFKATLPHLWRDTTPFDGVMRFTRSLYAEQGRVHAIALDRLARMLFSFLCGQGDSEAVGRALAVDYERTGRRPPEFLRPWADKNHAPKRNSFTIPARQARHLA